MTDRLPDLSARWRALLRDGGIGGEIAQHGGHVGMDHSGALGHPADRNQSTADAVLKDDGFRTQVGRHDRLCGIQASTVAELSEQLRESLDDSIDRQDTTDHAGRSDEDLL